MSTLSERDIAHIFEALRKGLVPERGLEALAVGAESERLELRRQLELVEGGEGSIKFLRGGYGCGKTFISRLALEDAQRAGFATSSIVVSESDLRLHRFDEVYRKILMELRTSSYPRGALGAIIDRWIARQRAELIAIDEGGAHIEEALERRIFDELWAMRGKRAPEEFIRVVERAIELKLRGERREADALIGWLSGGGKLPASIKRAEGLKDAISSREALDFLRGLLEIVKAAGYAGLVIVIDEAETFLRMRSDARHQSLNAIRQLADAAGSYPGLLIIVTGTPEFFDTRYGVAGLAPLHDRVRFIKRGRFTSLRQAQLELRPLDRERLLALALRLRALYLAGSTGLKRARVKEKISEAFIERLIDEAMEGLKGDMGVIPRQLLRELITQLDLADEYKDYDPSAECGFGPEGARPNKDERDDQARAPNGISRRRNHKKPDPLAPYEEIW